MGYPAGMPLYQCHKQVRALKIKELRIMTVMSTEGKPVELGIYDLIMVPQEEGVQPFALKSEYVEKHEPRVGGYYVVYENGYESYSPAKEFEEGYSLL